MTAVSAFMYHPTISCVYSCHYGFFLPLPPTHPLSTSVSTVLALRWSVFILFSALPIYLSRCFFSFFLAYFLFIAAHREMRTTTNYFLLNLSVADLLMSSLNCMFNFIYMLNSDWPFGSVYCSVNNFMGNVTVATSVFTLVAISFNRYVEQFKRMYR